jgi:hypothetical protein
MSSIRCKYCGLTNFADAFVCKKCGNQLKRGEKQRPPVRFSFYTLLSLAVVGAIVYYSIGGFEKAFDQVSRDESQQQSVKKAENPNNLSRTEYDRQRSNQFGNAVRDSGSLSQANNHNDELKKAMEQAR